MHWVPLLNCSCCRSETLSLHTHAVEIRPAIGGRGVVVDGGAIEPGNIGLNGDEATDEVGGALKKITAGGNALPRDDDPVEVALRHGGVHGQDGGGIGGIRAGDEFLPVIHAITIGVEKIGAAVGGKTVLLRPQVAEHGSGIGELVTANVHGAADNARVAVKVRGSDNGA